MAHWKYLPIIAIISKGLLNKRMLLSIIVVLRQNFVNTFIKIAILREIYQCSNCYAKSEQHWIECIFVHSSPINHLFDLKKFRALHLSAFSQKFPNCDLLHFGRFQILTLTPNRFKIRLMTHWHYLATITIINEDFLNEKLLLSIVVVLT